MTEKRTVLIIGGNCDGQRVTVPFDPPAEINMAPRSRRRILTSPGRRTIAAAVELETYILKPVNWNRPGALEKYPLYFAVYVPKGFEDADIFQALIDGYRKPAAEFKVGDRVHYQQEFAGDHWENGIVKEIPEHTPDAIRVVYNCGDDWENYQNYTSALTNLTDLKRGWK